MEESVINLAQMYKEYRIVGQVVDESGKIKLCRS